jgi:hypothetical protein
MQNPPAPESLITESDVEQKFAWPLLTGSPPHGLGLSAAELFTKPDIRAFEIDKGHAAKRYFPDYVASVISLPVLVVEVKRPGEDLAAAAREARLYATELNALYGAGLNPCRFCIVTDGLNTQLRSSDSDNILASFTLAEANAVTPAFADFLNLAKAEVLRSAASDIRRRMRPAKLYRALSLLGGQTVQNEQIPPNDFGRVLAANFQPIFDPGSYEDRKKIVQNAYVGSPRKTRYAGEIDRIIRNAAPAVAAEALLIEDVAAPHEVSHRFADLPALRNKILLLVGSVGSGKSTFVDYLRECVLTTDIQEHCAWVRIDLNPAPVTSSEIYPWLRRQIIAGIKASSPDIDTDTLEGRFKLHRKELQELEAIEGELFGTDSVQYKQRVADRLDQLRQDDERTMVALEQMLCTGRGRLLIVVLDNCDKRNRDQQLLMFQVAKYIQSEIRCLVVLPLRHETYENHRHEPPLDTALKDLVFRIEPPSFQHVLKARLGLVVKESRLLGPRKLSYHAGGKTIELPAEKLERFLHAMMAALFEHQHYGRKIIFGLAGWNIRLAFEMFLEFCRSGFIQEEDIFAQQAATGQVANLSHSVVAKILLRTNRRYYDGDESYVKNLFQVNPSTPAPFPLLRYWILSWLRANAQVAGSSGFKGYHRLGDLVHQLVAVGADGSAVRTDVHYLSKAGCILPEHLRAESIDDSDLIAITPAGHVHLELAHQDINYLAACAEDAWVTDQALAERVRQRISQQPVFHALSWRNTLATAADLCRYLDVVQNTTGARAEFLSHHSFSPSLIRFQQTLQRIENYKSQLKSSPRGQR